jgi:hypothetical protein
LDPLKNKPILPSTQERLDMFEPYRVSALNTSELPIFEKIYMQYFSMQLDKEQEYTNAFDRALRYAVSQLNQGSDVDYGRLSVLANQSPAWAEHAIYEELLFQNYSFKLNNDNLAKMLKRESPYINIPFGRVW